jgi:hypothetical protein
MLYRVRGSTFRTLSVCNEFPLVVTFSTCHIFAALSILDLSTSLLRLLQQALLMIVRVRILEIPAAVLLQEQQRSPALGATPPLLHASLSLIWLITTAICPMAKRPRNLETGYQRFRLLCYSQ